jgi:hypothetical protein
MNRKVYYCQFHSPVFISGVNVGNEINMLDKTSRWSDASMYADSVGVYIRMRPSTRPTAEEYFVPWTNVKGARLAPEETLTPTRGASSVKAVA